jgi:ATP-binding cassette subfamily C protein
VLIPQEAYVFSGTLWSNLTYLCPDAPAERIADAVDALGAHDMVTEIGGLGATITPARLSAGQRQLISLVRAYLSPAPIAVLDEATCHMDPSADRRVEAAFAARPGTLIVIAHRLSSAVRARRVLVIDGVRTAVGDHAALLGQSALYRELWQHWVSQPAGVTSGPDGLDTGAGAGLGQHTR